MKERPILFSGPMVRAILAGRKTQTRRIVKPHRDDDCFVLVDYGDGWWPWRSDDGESNALSDGTEQIIRCPYGHPCDRLWVRETWAYGIHALAAERDEDGPFVYAADGTTQGRLCDRWRPSIHMPRAASRITLEITDVRVERLQDISEEDCIAEGVYSVQSNDLGTEVPYYRSLFQPRDLYKMIWESIHGAGAWDANPWVWVIEFKRAEASIE